MKVSLDGFNIFLWIVIKNSSIKSIHHKQDKHNSQKYAELLLEEVSKDVRLINIGIWLDYIEQLNGDDLIDNLQNFTNTNVLHLWWYNGHLELIEQFLNKEPELVNQIDFNSNTSFHSLWSNFSSDESVLIKMYEKLKKNGLKIDVKNSDGNTGIDMLIQRIKNVNPYDENLDSIKLLYCYILDNSSTNVHNKLKKQR